jgi:hypothetical protein
LEIGRFLSQKVAYKNRAATLPIDLNVAIVSPWFHTAKKGGVQATVEDSLKKNETPADPQ